MLIYYKQTYFLAFENASRSSKIHVLENAKSHLSALRRGNNINSFRTLSSQLDYFSRHNLANVPGDFHKGARFGSDHPTIRGLFTVYDPINYVTGVTIDH